MDIDKNIKELENKGYTIIKNVLDDREILEYIIEFNNWMDSIPNLDELHKTIHYSGIFKYFQVGHQRFAWLLRTNPKIQNIFKKIWNTNELVVSFDGCCYYPKNNYNEDRYWIHSDQSGIKKGFQCVQSFLSLTSNKEKTFVVYEGSHKLHEHYSNLYNVTNPSDWNPISKNYVEQLEEYKKVLHVEAGSLVLWDSRTFHQNSCGPINSIEDRLVQYLCFLPKNHINNTYEQEELRKYYFDSLTTTNHFPYPMSGIPLQPNYYNSLHKDNPIYIDYKNLPLPDLDDMYDKILELL